MPILYIDRWCKDSSGKTKKTRTLLESFQYHAESRGAPGVKAKTPVFTRGFKNEREGDQDKEKRTIYRERETWHWTGRKLVTQTTPIPHPHCLSSSALLSVQWERVWFCSPSPLPGLSLWNPFPLSPPGGILGGKLAGCCRVYIWRAVIWTAYLYRWLNCTIRMTQLKLMGVYLGRLVLVRVESTPDSKINFVLIAPTVLYHHLWEKKNPATQRLNQEDKSSSQILIASVRIF